MQTAVREKSVEPVPLSDSLLRDYHFLIGLKKVGAPEINGLAVEECGIDELMRPLLRDCRLSVTRMLTKVVYRNGANRPRCDVSSCNKWCGRVEIISMNPYRQWSIIWSMPVTTEQPFLYFATANYSLFQLTYISVCRIIVACDIYYWH